MIRWFANNGIAANFLMLGILVAGVYTAIYQGPGTGVNLQGIETIGWSVGHVCFLVLKFSVV